MTFFIAAALAFLASFIAVPALLGVLRSLGVYTIVAERRCAVYTLFGNVCGIIDEPGIHCLWAVCGWRGLIVNWFGRCDVLALDMDQTYLRNVRLRLFAHAGQIVKELE